MPVCRECRSVKYASERPDEKIHAAAVTVRAVE
jgi:hypothetical protein